MLDFLGIGAQKCGTTWLYEQLGRHPEIEFPAGKEIHFWNAHRARGIEWYRSLFIACASGRKKGEITPAYALLLPSTLREIREFAPGVRMIYVIRNPIERAWSAACMALERAEMALTEASDQWFIDHFRSSGSLRRGDYESCLRNWRSVFGAEPILVLRYEMLCREPLAFLQACCRHLGVDPTFYSSAQPDTLAQRIFAGPGHPLRPSLLPVLHEIYRPKIASLADYLGLDLSEWERFGVQCAP